LRSPHELAARQIAGGAIVSGANPILGSRAAGARELPRAAGRHVRACRLIGMSGNEGSDGDTLANDA